MTEETTIGYKTTLLDYSQHQLTSRSGVLWRIDWFFILLKLSQNICLIPQTTCVVYFTVFRTSVERVQGSYIT